MKQNILIFIIIVFAVGAGSFYGGMKYQSSKQPSFPSGGNANRQNFRQIQPGQTRGNVTAGTNFTSGEIISQDNSSLTLKLRDGGSKIVFTTGANITKTASGTPSDLTVGEQITAVGINNADGSITAHSIQLGSGFGAR